MDSASEARMRRASVARAARVAVASGTWAAMEAMGTAAGTVFVAVVATRPAARSPQLVPLRGGCPGGKGGATFTAAVGGRVGTCGGALEVTALRMIDVSGALRAAGSGGGAALSNAGGGAGGSGGAILLDGDVVHVEASGALCANGGGGGQVARSPVRVRPVRTAPARQQPQTVG